MHLTRLAASAAAAALIGAPALAVAQDSAAPAPSASAPAAPPSASSPATPPSASSSVAKITGGTDIYSTLKASGQFTILVKALDQSGLAPILQKYPVTFFAPTDQALTSLPQDVLSKLMANNDTSANQLQQILKYHLINAQVDSSKIKGAKGPVPTVESTPVVLDGSNPNGLLVNNADILQADVRTANGGIIYVIDKVLIPSDSPYASLGQSAAPAAPPAPAGS
jgi:uncharacterized surface protein with fasciclin (FAS1) repeats